MSMRPVSWSGLAAWPANWLRLRWRWRKCRKRGSSIRVLVRSYGDLAHALKNADIPHVLLRGHPDVHSLWSQSTDSDFDVLIDYREVHRLLNSAAIAPGQVPVDVYFDLRPSVRGFHYYPPALALETLNSAVEHTDGYRVPDPRRHFMSLAYHLVYHKGLDESLDDPVTQTAQASPHYETLARLAPRFDVGFEGPIELLRLHDWLERETWSMPRDLLLRWPRRHRLLEMLHERSTARLRAINPSPDCFVFLVRSDASEPAMLAQLQSDLQTELFVDIARPLGESERARLVRHTRGGNWYERSGAQLGLIGPTHVFICRTRNATKAEDFCQTRLASFKGWLRERLNDRFPINRNRRYALHCGDDMWDSLECLTYLD